MQMTFCCKNWPFFLEKEKFEGNARLLTLLNHFDTFVLEISEYKLNSLALAMISYETEWKMFLGFKSYTFRSFCTAFAFFMFHVSCFLFFSTLL